MVDRPDSAFQRRRESPLPDSATEEIGFGIYSVEGNDIRFQPLYFPERCTITTDKKLNKTKNGCEGQEVRIKTLKNSKVHITGLCLASEISSLRKIAETTEPIDVISETFDYGGLEVYAKKVERGDRQGWDAYAQEHIFNYTMDLVSTGKDEYEAGTTGGRFEDDG